MRPTMTALNAMLFSFHNVALILDPGRYPEIRENLLEHLRGLGLPDLSLPGEYRAYMDQLSDLGPRVRERLNEERMTIGGDVLAITLFYLVQRTHSALMRIAYSQEWVEARAEIVALMAELGVEEHHASQLEEEGAWLHLWKDEDLLTPEDVKKAVGGFVMHVLQEAERIEQVEALEKLRELAGTEPEQRGRATSTLVGVLGARGMPERVRERLVSSGMVPEQAEGLTVGDQIGLTKRWIRWRSGGAPIGTDDLLIWAALTESEENSARTVHQLGEPARQALSSTKRRQGQHSIILIHGIRTRAAWQSMVVRVLRDSMPGIEVYPIRYGYFDAIRFWCPAFTREGPIRTLTVKINSAVAKAAELQSYPLISIVAHSFGGYALSRILDRNPALKPHWLVLCGCVLPVNWRWDYYAKQFTGGVVNECGTRDAWPLLAQMTTWGYGESGTFGFGHAAVRDRFHDLGHSEFFTEEFVKEWWVPLFRDGEVRDSVATRASPLYLRVMSWPGLRWIVLGFIILCGAAIKLLW